MPYTNVNVHFVWSTKYRFPYLNHYSLRNRVWFHIKENAAKKGIFVDTINGHNDHCHALVSMPPTMSMSKVMQLIKGESSHWINENKLCRDHFKWQDDYYAASVSKSILKRVRTYIRNQEEKHRNKTWEDEERELIEKYGLVKYKDNFVPSKSNAHS